MLILRWLICYLVMGMRVTASISLGDLGRIMAFFSPLLILRLKSIIFSCYSQLMNDILSSL